MKPHGTQGMKQPWIQLDHLQSMLFFYGIDSIRVRILSRRRPIDG